MAVSDTAYIAKNVELEDSISIGANTKVWDYSHIRRGAQIGDNSIIGRNVQIDVNVKVGSGCKIQNGIAVYSGVTLEDDVFVGPFAVFTNDHNPRAFNSDWKITPTVVHKGASIGANATIVCGNDIGEYALVAAGAVVTRPVKSYELVAGVPAKHLGWVDKNGEVISRDVEPPVGMVSD